MAPENPISYLNGETDSAVYFVHGFTGKEGNTWCDLPHFLATDPELRHFDFYSWGYPTELNLLNTVTKHFWSDDPNLTTIGQGLRTLLDHTAGRYHRLVLVGHSMGGLVIQTFIVEELLRRRRENLDRLTEVVCMGTPSAGLKKAQWGGFLKRQIADMSVAGDFVQDLRSHWKQLVDDQRSNPRSPARFRLTLVAGMKDTFVPQASSLDPFPLDEKEIVPGNHVEMIKPAAATDLVYQVLKRRLLRRTLTSAEWEAIQGLSEEAIRRINRIRAATELGDTADLVDLAKEALGLERSNMPLVDRALGLALLDHEHYQLAVDLLTRFLEFEAPGEGCRSFAADTQVVQQLAIALSAINRITDAVSRLRQLEALVPNDPETQGILAGRFKRQWLKSCSSLSLGWRAYNLYKGAFESAIKAGDANQAFYNGINAAYMSFALGGNDYNALANEVLGICQCLEPPDYWAKATCAEAYLLLGNYQKAAQAYDEAKRNEHQPRHWSSTGQQALNIINRQGNSPEAESIRAMFATINPDF